MHRFDNNSLELHYQNLGLEKNATLKEIKKVYYKLALKYHPDSMTETHDISKFHKISESYQYLLKYKTQNTTLSEFKFKSHRFDENSQDSIYDEPVNLNVDIESLSCNCSDWIQNRKKYKKNDPRRLCRHLINMIYNEEMKVNIDTTNLNIMIPHNIFLQYKKALLYRMENGFFLWKEKVELKHFTIFLYNWKDTFGTTEPKPCKQYDTKIITDIDIFAKDFEEKPIWIAYNLDRLRWANNRPKLRSLKTRQLPLHIDEVKSYIIKRFDIDKRYLDFPYNEKYLISKYKGTKAISHNQFNRIILQENLVKIKNGKKVLTEKGKRFAWVPYCDDLIVWYEQSFSELLEIVYQKIEDKQMIISKKKQEICKYCGSEATIKRGIKITKNDKKQRYQCKACHRFFFKII